MLPLLFLTGVVASIYSPYSGYGQSAAQQPQGQVDGKCPFPKDEDVPAASVVASTTIRPQLVYNAPPPITTVTSVLTATVPSMNSMDDRYSMDGEVSQISSRMHRHHSYHFLYRQARFMGMSRLEARRYAASMRTRTHSMGRYAGVAYRPSFTYGFNPRHGSMIAQGRYANARYQPRYYGTSPMAKGVSSDGRRALGPVYWRWLSRFFGRGSSWWQRMTKEQQEHLILMVWMHRVRNCHMDHVRHQHIQNFTSWLRMRPHSRFGYILEAILQGREPMLNPADHQFYQQLFASFYDPRSEGYYRPNNNWYGPSHPNSSGYYGSSPHWYGGMGYGGGYSRPYYGSGYNRPYYGGGMYRRYGPLRRSNMSSYYRGSGSSNSMWWYWMNVAMRQHYLMSSMSSMYSPWNFASTMPLTQPYVPQPIYRPPVYQITQPATYHYHFPIHVSRYVRMTPYVYYPHRPYVYYPYRPFMHVRSIAAVPHINSIPMSYTMLY